MTDVTRGVLRPTWIVQVYDRHAAAGGEEAPVARVESDGARGRVLVEPDVDPKLRAAIEKLFDAPRLVLRGPAGGGVPVVLRPYGEASLEHAMKHGLPLHNLRAVVLARPPP